MGKRVAYVAIIIGLKDEIALQIQALFLLNIFALVYQAECRPFIEII